MADVNPLRSGVRDRGQMLLVAAFGVAVMLVALALILNTAIYTENIATRGSDISGGKDALRYRAVTEDAMAGAIQYVNEHNNTSDGDYTNLTKPMRNATWNFSNMSGRIQATNSLVVNVSEKPYAPSEGTHAFQTGDFNFSNASADPDWTLVKKSHGVRRFSFNVTESSMETANLDGVSAGGAEETNTVFHVNLTDRGDEAYNVFIYDDGSNIVVEVEEGTTGTEFGFCTATYETLGSHDRATVNLTNGTVQGEPCGPLREWWSLQGAPFTVHFNNTCYDASVGGLISSCSLLDAGNTTRGEFSVILNRSINDTFVNAGTGTAARNNPNATTAVYSTTVHLTYESKRLYFETDVRVAPGERNE